MKKILAAAVIASSLFSCQSAQKKAQVAKPVEKFQPNWESLAQYECPEWFRDAKLGIFIHWGPYSVPAFGSEWYPRGMYQDSVVWGGDGKVQKKEPNWMYKHHKKVYGGPEKMGYKEFIPQFKAEKFNAEEWISIFQRSGAKYVVPVAEHHDGFAMYKSNVTRWNSVDMGPKRDVLGELTDVAHKKGMKIGASSHFAFNWNYYNKKKGWDTMDPEFGDLYSKNYEGYRPADKEFLELWWKRTRDIIDNYKPDVLWFDFVLDHEEFDPYHPELAAYYYNKGEEWGKGVCLQTKNFGRETFPEGTHTLDLERGKMSGIQKEPWQTDTSIGKNSWCYVSNWDSKTANTLIDDLIDIVSKNGNLLLNVGPKADGTIPEDQIAVLYNIGDWLKVNGEAIYGTRPWTRFGEGPTEVKTGHHTEGKNKELTAKDFRFTAKGKDVYAICMDIPKDKKVVVTSMSTSELTETVKAVTLLGSDQKLSYKQTKKGLEVTIPNGVEGEYACTFKVQF